MSKSFEEIDFKETPYGDISLRRRRIPMFGDEDIFEVKLNDEWLMSSLFFEAEVALADLGLADLDAPALDVVVGGLGLGYTAVAALKNPKVRSLIVVEALSAVIGWHENGLVPLGRELSGDPRCRLVANDFFAVASTPEFGFDPAEPGKRFHAVLLDIDHSPDNLLNENNRPFYSVEGLRKFAENLHPGGVFALWSDDPPEEGFLDNLAEVFHPIDATVVEFKNPFTGKTSSNTVYVARKKP